MTFFARKTLTDWAPLGLLGAAFLLQGAKTPISFLIWGTLSLSLSLTLFVMSGEKAFTTDHWPFGILLVCILAAQAGSVDPSVSLFKTLQALIFLLMWHTFKSAGNLMCDTRLLRGTLWGLACLTIAYTSKQFLQRDWTWAYGFLPVNPHFNATWMASLAVFFTVTGSAALQRDSRAKTAYFDILLAILLIALVSMGASRSTLLAIGIGLLVALSPWITRRRALMGLSFCVLLLTILAHTKLSGRLRLTEINYRPQMWEIALQTMQKNPLTGIGFGNFEGAYQRQAIATDSEAVRFSHTTAFVHNDYLQLGSDIGLPALVVILIALGQLLFVVKPSNDLARAAKSALCVLCVVAFYNPMWQLPFLLYWTLLLSTLLVQNASPVSPPALRPRRSHTFTVFVSSALVIEVLMGWCAMRDHWLQTHNWSSILRLNPTDALAWQQSGQSQSDPGRAAKAYALAAEYLPHQAYFRESYARALEAMQSTESAPYAIAEYLYALDLAPQRATNDLSIGRILYREGDYRVALTWFQQARHLEPRYWQCDLWIARCFAKLGEISRARWILKNLSKRREAYLSYREKNRTDLPYENLNTIGDYGEEILSYDAFVVRAEIRLLSQ